MISLWDTTGNEVVKALAAERRSAGGVASGMALTLVVIVDEPRVREAEAAVTIASAAHPCRLLVVVRSDIERDRDRLDAEIVVGGRLGPGEAVVMRMYGRLALHAESVVMPLLVPDVPVVTWWHGEPPEEIATDFLGVVADRRITDSAQAPDPIAALHQRARDYVAGDTDLAWARITPWRTLVAGAFDTTDARVVEAKVVAPATDPTAALMCGWLAARLAIRPRWEETTEFPRMRSVELRCANGEELVLTRQDGTAMFRRNGKSERDLPLARRPLGEELAEELRRLDADQVYAEALGAAAGVPGLESRRHQRLHVWRDPSRVRHAAGVNGGGPETPARSGAKGAPHATTEAAVVTTAAAPTTAGASSPGGPRDRSESRSPGTPGDAGDAGASASGAEPAP